ncbi:replication endonuclease [Vibrio cholerae]|nr:replication endonuclease [Vibrio cholerae]
MAYQDVIDFATGKREVIDFLPASTWISAKDAHWKNWTGRRHNHATLSDLSADKSYRPEIVALNRKLSVVSNSLDNLIPSHDRTESHASPLSLPPCQDVAQYIRRHGDFAPHMQRAFTNILERRDYTTALSMIKDAHDRLSRDGIRFARTDDECVELAKAKAKAFSKTLSKYDEVEERFTKACELLASLGLSFRPELIKQKRQSNELECLTSRAMCENWLRRQLRRRYFAEVEAVARDLLLVSKNENPYCSAHGLEVMKSRKSATEQVLSNTVCYVEDNPETWFTLQELAAKSLSNPTIRRAEMFVRLKAFEDICKESGHVAMFYTVTAPSRFHVFKGDDINPKWLEAGKPSAIDAHHHLMGVTNAFRKALDKAKIKIYGLRIVEPHHDGTPHNHFLFFMLPEHESVVTRILGDCALSDSPNESGAKKYRFKAEKIDFKKGSAVGYVAKYLSKNIDGQHIDFDRNSNKSGTEAAQSVVSFNRLNGVRQFQFYGGCSVSVWREMRRLRDEIKEDDAVITSNQFSKDEHFVLETIRRAADEGDFKRFLIAMGGVFVKRKEQTLQTAYAKKINVDGLFLRTRYGDEMSTSIQGILFKGRLIPTRFKDWRFATKKQFIRGIRTMMTGARIIFSSLEEEFEYRSMLAEEYERMQEEAAFWFEVASAESCVMYGDEIYLEDAPPPDWCWGWAQPDPDINWAALDSCH